MMDIERTWTALKKRVVDLIHNNRQLFTDGSSLIGQGEVIQAGTNITATKSGSTITLSASDPGTGGMEQHSNEYHTPDMALGTHNHSGTYDPAGTGNTEATAHVAAHALLATGVHGAESFNLEHTGHKNAASGYPGLDTGGLVLAARLGSGTPSSTTYLRGDRTWATPTATAADTKYMIYVNFGSNPNGQMYLT